MYEIRLKRKELAGALGGLIEKHRSSCDPAHAALLDVLGELSHYLVSGHLAQMSKIRCAVNRRIFGPRADTALSKKYRSLRRALAQLRTVSQSFKRDAEVAEFAHLLATVYRLLAIDPNRTTPGPDGHHVCYAVFFVEVMRAAMVTVSVLEDRAAKSAA